MRRAVLVAIVVLAVATAAHAQFRGRLTSPTTPVPISPAPPAIALLPVWWQWDIVTRPQTITLTPPRVAEGAPTGGVQLDVLPWSALVYVDGALAGRVDDFRGYYHHLELPSGPHAIAIVAAGAEPHVFDIVVVPGKTLTYRTTVR
jgi:hypothetical protein